MVCDVEVGIGGEVFGYCVVYCCIGCFVVDGLCIVVYYELCCL